MHEAARLRPVVIDESLIDLETLLLAREMGYTGVALKACKGQSQSLLMAAAAQKFGMFLCVQDLTCPGASLIHSAGLAARVPGNAGIESNARQFVPERERGVGGTVPGAVHHSRRRDEHRAADRSGVGSRASDWRWRCWNLALSAESRVGFERDDRDFQHPGFGKRQRPELLAHARLGISLHEQAGAGDICAVPDLPDEALGVERTRSRDFIRDT